MMVKVEREEWYPVYVLSPNQDGLLVELSDADLALVQKAAKDFAAAQEILSEAYNKEADVIYKEQIAAEKAKNKAAYEARRNRKP